MPTGIGRGFAWPALQAMLNYKGGQGFKDFSTAWRNPFTGVTMKPGTYTPDPNVAVIPPTYSNSPYAVLPPYNATRTTTATQSPTAMQSQIMVDFSPDSHLTAEQKAAEIARLNAAFAANAGKPYTGDNTPPRVTPTSPSMASTATPTTPSSPFRPQRYAPERDYRPFPLYNRISPFAR